VTYQQHEVLPDGAVLMAVTEDGCTVGYVFRDGRWFGKDYVAIRDPHKILKLGELFASGRARQSIDRALDI
jgi:hypothetical protein